MFTRNSIFKFSRKKIFQSLSWKTVRIDFRNLGVMHLYLFILLFIPLFSFVPSLENLFVKFHLTVYLCYFIPCSVHFLFNILFSEKLWSTFRYTFKNQYERLPFNILFLDVSKQELYIFKIFHFIFWHIRNQFIVRKMCFTSLNVYYFTTYTELGDIAKKMNFILNF